MLTDSQVRTAKSTERPYKLADSRGLYLQIAPNGGRYWRFNYRFRGRQKTLALGTYPDVPLFRARERHHEARRLLAEGVNPGVVKQAVSRDFEAVAREWFAHWKTDRNCRYSHYVITRLEADVFPVIGHRPVAELTTSEFRDAVRKIEQRGAPEIARRVLTTCGQIMRYAIAHDLIQRNPVADVRPADILRPRKKRHYARVTEQELPDLLRAIDGYVGAEHTRRRQPAPRHRCRAARARSRGPRRRSCTVGTEPDAGATRAAAHRAADEGRGCTAPQPEDGGHRGNLTGGIAHDFNNLLHVIGGNLHLLKRDVAGNAVAQQRVQKALDSVVRSAKLSQQLLAFARRQPLDPKVIRVGRFISDMQDMLQNAVGGDVTLQLRLDEQLWNTLVDPASLENALLNLAINARDAMDGRGELTITAHNVVLDAEYVLLHPEVTPGQYVHIAVRDTGAGMSPDVAQKAFDPFFTTKPEGRGTGLGLSMVYGFVKQSGGHIVIDSEPGQGATLQIYLPRSMQSEDTLLHAEAAPVTGGTEMVLVAEDDESVRETVVAMLNDLGYRVLKAKDAQGALTIIESGMHIDLLFTDVVMPGPLKSTELARKARERMPNLAVLFTSGYSETAIASGRLAPDVELLGKPYSREALARKVRAVLEQAAARARGN